MRFEVTAVASLWSEFCDLSILFVRFRHRRNYVSQALSILSILFVRFEILIMMRGERFNYAFNSLCEIQGGSALSYQGWHDNSFNSLCEILVNGIWHSKNICILSILFVRFTKISQRFSIPNGIPFNSLCEIPRLYSQTERLCLHLLSILFVRFQLEIVKIAYVFVYVLSILFVRFEKRGLGGIRLSSLSFNSLCEILI